MDSIIIEDMCQRNDLLLLDTNFVVSITMNNISLATYLTEMIDFYGNIRITGGVRFEIKRLLNSIQMDPFRTLIKSLGRNILVFKDEQKMNYSKLSKRFHNYKKQHDLSSVDYDLLLTAFNSATFIGNTVLVTNDTGIIRAAKGIKKELVKCLSKKHENLRHNVDIQTI